MVSSAREAHKAGQVWVEVKINGGSVPIMAEGGHPVGTMSMKGPMSPEEAFVLWMAAKKLDPASIETERAKVFGPRAAK